MLVAFFIASGAGREFCPSISPAVVESHRLARTKQP
jgi:hypothetical protein